MNFVQHRNFSFYPSAVSFFLFLLYTLYLIPNTFAQSTDNAGSLFILKGNTKLSSGKYVEGVEMELKKDGVTISKISSGKNGKYSLQMQISTTNKNNEYLLYITKEGTVPKTLSINTYIPQFELHEFNLEVMMIETNVKDIVIERPSGKIRWDIDKHDFAFDQTYANIIRKEEEKLKDDPDKYLKELSEKKKKEEEEIAKKKVEEDARHKADEKAKRIADQKGKEEADKILQKNLEAMKQELRKKRQADSMAAIESAVKMEIQKFATPVSPEDVDQNAFDGTGAYLINIAKKSLNKSKEKINKEKAKNLSAKYETNNTLTSLLNMVDEYDKKQKSK